MECTSFAPVKRPSRLSILSLPMDSFGCEINRSIVIRCRPPPIPNHTSSEPCSEVSTIIELTVAVLVVSRISGLTNSSALFLVKTHHGIPLLSEPSEEFQAISPKSDPISRIGVLPKILACPAEVAVALEFISNDERDSTKIISEVERDCSETENVVLQTPSFPIISIPGSNESEANWNITAASPSS